MQIPTNNSKEIKTARLGGVFFTIYHNIYYLGFIGLSILTLSKRIKIQPTN